MNKFLKIPQAIVIAFLFAISLLIGCGEDSKIWDGKVDTKWYNETQNEFIITTPQQLAGFAQLVSAKKSFKGKTVKLGADIMLNDTTNWQNWANEPPKNKWMPIGELMPESSESEGIISKIKNFFAEPKADEILFSNIESVDLSASMRIDEKRIKSDAENLSKKKGQPNLNGKKPRGKGQPNSPRQHRLYPADITKKSCFNGTFDGAGFIVSGVNVPESSELFEEYRGLFCLICADGTVKNLGITASYIRGSFSVGGLAGGNIGTIINSYFTGTVNGRANVIGGLVGENSGDISNSYSISIVSGADIVGGLAGNNGGKKYGIEGYSQKYGIEFSGTIDSSYFIGTVTGNRWVGGLVGSNGSGTINSSFSTGHVTAEQGGCVGGLAGSNGSNGSMEAGTINNSYSTSTVTGAYDGGLIPGIGGLVGLNSEGSSVIKNSYSTGAVTVTGECIDDFGKTRKDCYFGGLVGANGYSRTSFGSKTVTEPAGKILGSYYDTQTSGQEDKDKGIGKTTAQMKQKATFVDWDFDEVWGINDRINNGYPYLLKNAYKSEETK